MNKLLILMCGVLIMSTVALADDTTTTCANGAGTVITGAVTGHKYCKANRGMDYWNAYAWCDGQGRRLFDLSDCACSDTVSDCSGKKCPELNGVAATNVYVRTSTPSSSTHAYHVYLYNGTVLSSGDRPRKEGSHPPLCY